MAGGSLGELSIKLSADTAQAIGGIGKAAHQINRNFAQIEHGITNLRNAFVALGSLGGVGLMIKSAIDAGDQLNKLSQKVGISVESLSGLKLGAQLADVDLDALTTGLKKFNVALTEAQDANSKAGQIFKALGVDITQGPEAALRQFAEAMSKMKDGATKTAVATELLGRAGINMIPWLNEGAAGMDKAALSAQNLGLVISADFAAKAEQFNDNMKLLGKRTDALGVSIASQLVPGLSSFTGQLVEAAEKGNLLAGTLKELIKLDLALFAKLPGPLGAMADLAAQRMFANTPEGTAFGGAVSGRIRRPGGDVLGPSAPNPEAVACAASGGKWVNGQCVRAGVGGKDKGMSAEELFAKQQMTILRQQEELTKEAEEKHTQMVKEATELEMRNRQAVFDMIDREQAEAIEQTRLYLDALGKEAKKTDDVARQLGLTFTSAFEDAVVAGKKFSEVLKGLAQDLTRFVFRKTVTEPLGNMATDFFGGFLKDGFGGLFGGGGGGGGGLDGNAEGALIGAFDSGTDFVPRTGLALVHQGEAIIPASQNNRGGGEAVTINFNITTNDSRSFAQSMAENRRVIEGVVEQAFSRAGRRSGMALG